MVGLLITPKQWLAMITKYQESESIVLRMLAREIIFS
jgi:hypothetical protein